MLFSINTGMSAVIAFDSDISTDFEAMFTGEVWLGHENPGFYIS